MFGPALLLRTGISVEDFEPYGSLHMTTVRHGVHSRVNGIHALIIIDADKGGGRTGKSGHRTLFEQKPL